jgi:hypothetical protein
VNLPGDPMAPTRPALTKPLLATAAITVAAAAAVLVWAFVAGIGRERPLGDGRDPRTYGFELGTLPDDPGFAVSGQPRDFMPSLDGPERLRGDEIADYNRTHRRRPVVSADRVVGVVIGGEARAYPVPLLEAHEIVNDVLGGVPIAVSFSPLADAAVVFDRRVGDRTCEFALSGLMLDSAHLLYDRVDRSKEAGSSSLWSPMRLRAIAGPIEGEALRAIPFVSLARWSDWLAAHPETTVALGDEGSRLRDRRIDYTHELTRPGLTFPVAGIDAASMATFGEEDWRRLKAPALAVRGVSGSWQVLDLEALRDGADERSLEFDGVALRIRLGDDARSAVVLADGESSEAGIVVIPCLRFAADRIVADRAPARRPDE